ncbi:hypothetical protein SKAU_G00230610 [Synaphobranchus kaupii]|uniref:Uncharacterized protein n=1 Tax=Synaphobranchus kaupii TaxID=118154 RepID=A0A9Q1F5S5_SYNKA|nr:hypothetical protein SKAU_G00230610 [Synaphobranchus kaupii]
MPGLLHPRLVPALTELQRHTTLTHAACQATINRFWPANSNLQLDWVDVMLMPRGGSPATDEQLCQVDLASWGKARLSQKPHLITDALKALRCLRARDDGISSAIDSNYLNIASEDFSSQIQEFRA